MADACMKILAALRQPGAPASCWPQAAVRSSPTATSRKFDDGDLVIDLHLPNCRKGVGIP